MNTFLLYGSYGYTGQLILDLAVQNGLKPLLAGRDEIRLKVQAEQYGLDYRAFSLDNSAALDSALREVDAVLHCAGPFVLTFRQMAEACLRTRRHYVDISGEIEGFEALAALDEEARAAGIMMLPGVGFDVVPTDCLAAHLKRRLPSATHLRLFIRSVGAGVSRGTAKSGIENMHRGGRIRRDGKIISVPPAWRILSADFGRGPVQTVSIGWGDVSTAYHSTSIPNVETYMAFPRAMVDALYLMRWFGPLMYSRPMKSLLQSLLNLTPLGPDGQARQRGRALIVGEVSDATGKVARNRLQTSEGYSFTAQATVEVMKRILGLDLRTGFQTPSQAYGADFVLQFSNVKREDL